MTTHQKHTTPARTKKQKAEAKMNAEHDAKTGAPNEAKNAAAQTDAHTDPFHAALAELEGMRDDVGLRVHLAGMELKNAWGDLDKRYLALRDVATHAKDEALTKARTGLMDIRKELHDLRMKLDGSLRKSDAKMSDDASEEPKPS